MNDVENIAVPTGEAQVGYADEVLREIWRIKDRLAQRDGYDVHRIAEAVRQRGAIQTSADSKP